MIVSQEALVRVVGGQLAGGVGEHPQHIQAVAPPEGKEALLPVRRGRGVQVELSPQTPVLEVSNATMPRVALKCVVHGSEERSAYWRHRQLVTWCHYISFDLKRQKAIGSPTHVQLCIPSAQPHFVQQLVQQSAIWRACHSRALLPQFHYLWVRGQRPFISP